jgi:DNA-binding transcriptional ArsR family regulator
MRPRLGNRSRASANVDISARNRCIAAGVGSRNMQGVNLDMLKSSAGDATRYLKALANQNRLLILCNLIEGEKSVGELERVIGLRQPTLSQQLARLRSVNLVRTRRDAKSIYYSIADDDIRTVLQVLYGKFCAPRTATPKRLRVNGRRAVAR